MAELLNRKPADVVALQEIRWSTLYANPALARLYPYRLDREDNSVPGMVLLSVYPIIGHGVVPGTVNATDSSGVVWARLDLGAGRTLQVFFGHPNAPYRHAAGCSPVGCFDPTLRDRQLTALRAFMDPLLARGEPILLLGDFNVTAQEPMYGKLVAGLEDAQRRVHLIGGATWRPLALRAWPHALLRLDYLLSGNGVTPLTLSVDCAPRGSDHCVVRGTFQLRATGG